MLGDGGIQSLLVEGGANTWARFLSEGLVIEQGLRFTIDLGGMALSSQVLSLRRAA